MSLQADDERVAWRQAIISGMNLPPSATSQLGLEVQSFGTALSEASIRLSTSDNALAAQQINACFGVEPRQDKGELIFEYAGGEELVPRLVEQLTVRIASVSVRRPTLDDVFIKLTGREIREAEADVQEHMRGRMRRRRR